MEKVTKSRSPPAQRKDLLRTVQQSWMPGRGRGSLWLQPQNLNKRRLALSQRRRLSQKPRKRLSLTSRRNQSPQNQMASQRMPLTTRQRTNKGKFNPSLSWLQLMKKSPHLIYWQPLSGQFLCQLLSWTVWKRKQITNTVYQPPIAALLYFYRQLLLVSSQGSFWWYKPMRSCRRHKHTCLSHCRPRLCTTCEEIWDAPSWDNETTARYHLPLSTLLRDLLAYTMSNLSVVLVGPLLIVCLWWLAC